MLISTPPYQHRITTPDRTARHRSPKSPPVPMPRPAKPVRVRGSQRAQDLVGAAHGERAALLQVQVLDLRPAPARRVRARQGPRPSAAQGPPTSLLGGVRRTGRVPGKARAARGRERPGTGVGLGRAVPSSTSIAYRRERMPRPLSVRSSSAPIDCRPRARRSPGLCFLFCPTKQGAGRGPLPLPARPHASPVSLKHSQYA